jgi:hypothetical protein
MNPAMAPIFELLFVACWLVFPALFACRLSRRVGVLLGTVTFWVFSIGHTILAPERYVLGGSGSLLFGWLSGFVYSALWYRVAQSLDRGKRLKELQHLRK